jgi:hypothetical protein
MKNISLGSINKRTSSPNTCAYNPINMYIVLTQVVYKHTRLDPILLSLRNHLMSFNMLNVVCCSWISTLNSKLYTHKLMCVSLPSKQNPVQESLETSRMSCHTTIPEILDTLILSLVLVLTETHQQLWIFS